MAQNEAKLTVTAEDRFSRTFANLKRDLAGSREQMAGLTEKAALASRALALISFGSAAGAGGFALAVKQLANDLDELNDAADATGSTVENLSALEEVARRNGATLGLATGAVVKMNQALKESTADSPITKALSAIGLSAAELRTLDPSEALRRIAVALAGYADDGNKARLVQELFGKSTREVAPFLKDLAEAGTLNAKVTTEQAQAAERFNKNLFELQTNSSNAARALVSELIPALNEYANVVKRASAKTFWQELKSEVQGLRLKVLVADIEALTDQLSRQPENNTLQRLLAEARAEYDKLSRSAAAANEQLKTTLGVGALTPNAGAGRGFVNPDPVKPSVGDTTKTEIKKAQVTEAQRLLETLEKQIGAEEKLTNYERLLLDIETKRIEGLNPAMEVRLKQTARFLDLLKQVNDEHEREAGFQKILADKSQKDINEALSLLSATPSGQRDNIDRQTDLILRAARANPDDAGIQRQASEALTNLRKQLDELNKPADEAKDQFDKLGDSIEKSMDRATASVLDFVTEGKGSLGTVFQSFKRDILRELIEEPIRDSMKNAARIIRDELKKVGEGGNPFEGILKWFQGLGGGGSGGGDGAGFFDSILKAFGSTGRAGGGGVKAGQIVRWQENGREWFVPGSDGTVLNPGQQRTLGAQAAPTLNTYITVNGDVSQQTVALVENALARNNARLVRSMRTGGAMAS